MEQIAWWQVVVAVFGGLGGLETIKWLINRRSHSRMAVAEAAAAEFRTLGETNEFLQRQLQNKEERFVEQTERLRRTQDDLFKAKEQEYEARLELAQKKCEDQTCPFRQPPNAYTPPRQGMTKEEFHASKEQKQ